ncbi:MAG TPA: serine protease, partial [Thiolinea sp.]|nr:serine protease [Thiolinea sp.]
GTNNGLLADSEDKNILFSGNLNSGMSGGPALNEQGEVVGVNVATAGNAVSFLVSIQYLNALLEKVKARDFEPGKNLHDSIVQQLKASSHEMLERLQANQWKLVNIGKFQIPSRIDRSISCWDGSENDEEHGLVTVISFNCSNDREIYLDEKLSVGSIQYQYTWYESEKMIPPRFYRMYEAQNSDENDSKASKENVTGFKCETNFLTMASQNFKMTVCRRDYIRYPGLSDVLVTGAMVSQKQQGFLFELFLTGVDFKEAMQLVKKIFENFKWQA